MGVGGLLDERKETVGEISGGDVVDLKAIVCSDGVFSIGRKISGM